MKKEKNNHLKTITNRTPHVLFDLCHPAHVHLFRNFINFVKSENYDVTVVSRDKDVTNQLLDEYGIEYNSISRASAGFFGKLVEFISRTRKILKLNREKQFDYAFGTSVSIGFLSLFSGVKSYVFNEDDDATVPFFCILAYPFAEHICNPEGLEYRKWRGKRYFFNSYHELAYLHPANFAPDKKVLEKYNVEIGKYAVIRLSALNAHHDSRAAGISDNLQGKIIERLKGLHIIVLKEGEEQVQYDVEGRASCFKLQVSDSHHLLAFTKILISDSQTMSIEAAVLGVPSVRISTFADKSSVLHELEDKYQLTRAFQPENGDEILDVITQIIEKPKSKKIYSERKEKMLEEKTDLNKWMKELL
jgi:predicted glycosyltransferase